MVIKLTDADQKQLNGMIERILFDVQRNELSPSNARDAERGPNDEPLRGSPRSAARS